jgi:hypothetical protein
MLLKLDLLITLYVTSASAFCELVLIIMKKEIALFCPGLPADIEKSTKHLYFGFLLIWVTSFVNLLVILVTFICRPIHSIKTIVMLNSVWFKNLKNTH